MFNLHFTDDLSTAPQVGLELDNLRTTAAWAGAQGDGELLARLATKPRNWLYNYFGAWDDWLGWLQKALALGIQDTRLKANCIQALGDVHRQLDELPEARSATKKLCPSTAPLAPAWARPTASRPWATCSSN